MKTIVKALSIIFLLVAAYTARATHSVGMEITYTYVGNTPQNTYRYLFRVSYYRDCRGVSAPGAMPLRLHSSCIATTMQVSLPKVSVREITEVCPPGKSTCAGGPHYGIEEYIYEKIIEIPACTDWVFSAQICCRNHAITTVVNPGSNSMYVESTLNNVAAPTNSSPRFSNIPVIQPFVNHQMQYNHGAYDPDGDALSYSTTHPKSSASSVVVYQSGYSSSNPFGSGSNFQINPGTGNLSAKPLLQMNTVMAVKVVEMRNGTVIGSVVRDIQINVTVDSNQVPKISGINGGTSYATTAYVGAQLCFNIYGSDPDPANMVMLSSDVATTIPAASFTLTPPGYHVTPKGEFCWTPTAADIGTHCFTVKAEDNACERPGTPPPYNGVTIQAYCITVEDKPCRDCPISFAPEPGKRYVLSAWVQESLPGALTFAGPEILLQFAPVNITLGPFKGKGQIIDGWQRIEEAFTVPVGSQRIKIVLGNNGGNDVYFDDIRFFPFDASMKSFVYDPQTLRLMAELDENNYATFYEYDEEGKLIRVKKETERGVMTIQESRNAAKKN